MAYDSLSPPTGPNLLNSFGRYVNGIGGNDILRTPRDGLDVDSHTSNTPKFHSRWNVEPVVYIQVEEILFVVPRDAFTEFGSDNPFKNFRSYRPSLHTSVTLPGMSRDSPLVCNDVKLVEMENFLTVIYPEDHSTEAPILNEDNALEYWDGVLRLAKMWNHGKAISKAIGAISSLGTIKSSKDAAVLLRIANENGLEGVMRTSAIHLICDTTLGLKELSEKPYSLEWELIARIVEARLKASMTFISMSKEKKGKIRQNICPHCKDSYYTASGALKICFHGAEKGFEESSFTSSLKSIVDNAPDINFGDEH